jgi:hypothetical protein
MRRRQVIAGLGSAAAWPGQPQSLVSRWLNRSPALQNVRAIIAQYHDGSKVLHVIGGSLGAGRALKTVVQVFLARQK